jgi:hypothetical protein
MIKYTKTQKEFLKRCSLSCESQVIPEGVELDGERENTKMLKTLAKKGILTFEHHSLGTTIVFLKSILVP